MDILQQMLFWSFVPGFATKFVLGAYHTIACPRNTPQPHDPRYKRNYNRAYIVVVVVYLVYSIVQAERSLPSNFHNLLNVGIGSRFEQKQLRTNYVAMSLQYHPVCFILAFRFKLLLIIASPSLTHLWLHLDCKLGPMVTSIPRSKDKSHTKDEQDMYILVRQAYETLRNPTLRQAYSKTMLGLIDYGMSLAELTADSYYFVPLIYKCISACLDKLGMDALECTHCKTERDFVHESTHSWLVFYSVTAGISVLLSILGRMDFGRYWRLSGLFAIAAIEAYLIFSADDIMPYVLPWRTVSQKIELLRQLFITVSIAIAQIGPILFPVDTRPPRHQILELEQAIDMQTRQAIGSFADAFLPYQSDPKAAGKLQRKMELLALQAKAVSNAAANSGTAHSNPSAST
ncbi:hypothetical protein BSLG_007598 [Batrachochytrium salamandrivorans]|nr:hypothetical protein BSLG_007598 [Batrachochytrium salamandrivorans]